MTTTRKTILRCFCVLLCCLVVVFSFAFSSSAVYTDYTFEVNYPNPIDNGYDGYITIPYQDMGRNYLKVVYWKFFNTNSISDKNESGQDPIVTVTFTSKKAFKINFSYLGKNPVGVYIAETDSNTSIIDDYSFEVISYDTTYNYTVSMGIDNFCKPQLYSGITEITSNSYLTSLPLKSYEVIWSNNTSFDQLTAILNHFDSLLDKTDFTNEQLGLLLNKFDSLISITETISSDLGEFVYYYWEQFSMYDFPTAIDSICGRLDTIIRILNKKGDVEQTTVDSSKFDNYMDIEQSLLDNNNADSAIGNMDVSIDGASYSFIWSLITDFFSTHSAVIALAVTILTLGFIALLLNR